MLQVLRVLVDNALRHTPPGSTVTLRTETTPVGREHRRVGQRPRHPARAAGARLRAVLPRPRAPPLAASGLGLAIARELAERMERPAARRRAAPTAPASRSSCPAASRSPRPPTLGHRDTRAALASVVIAARRGHRRWPRWLWRSTESGGERVTTIVRTGGARRQRSPASIRWRSMPERATASSRSRRPSASDEETAGSGFVVDARRGLIVTASHVVPRRTAGSASADACERRPHRARRRNPRRREPARLRPLRGHRAAAGRSGGSRAARAAGSGGRGLLRVGDSVAVIGSPFENRASLSTGVVSQLDRQIAAPGVCFPHDRRDPDRRGGQSGQLGRPAARRAGTRRRHGHRDQPDARGGVAYAVPIEAVERPTARSPPAARCATPGWASPPRR